MALARLGSGDEVARTVPHAQPDQSHAHGRRRRALQGRAVRVAGDVYARAPHAGRAGWSWYTGSAAWMYRAGLESMLGLRRRGDDVQRRSLHPFVVAGVRDRVACRTHAVS